MGGAFSTDACTEENYNAIKDNCPRINIDAEKSYALENIVLSPKTETEETNKNYNYKDIQPEGKRMINVLVDTEGIHQKCVDEGTIKITSTCTTPTPTPTVPVVTVPTVTVPTVTVPVVTVPVVTVPVVTTPAASPTPTTASPTPTAAAADADAAAATPRTCADTAADGSDTAHDCESHANGPDTSPESITCAGDTCTDTECCTVATFSNIEELDNGYQDAFVGTDLLLPLIIFILIIMCYKK